MASIKQRAIAEVVEREGGYVNHPADRGGPTRYGVTEKVAREYGYKGRMRELPLAMAIEIYEKQYWDILSLDDVYSINQPLAVYMFDYAVHSSPYKSAKELQITLNVLNDRQKLYKDIEDDGVVGTETLKALGGFRVARGSDDLDVLAEVVNGCRIAFCRQLCINKESQEAFALGWFRRIVHLSQSVNSQAGHEQACKVYEAA